MKAVPTKILSADFLTTAAAKAGWPEPSVPEFAFAGRSNVGKSSMINTLVQRRNLVRVSNTPGRTRALNFFDVAVEDDGGQRHAVRFCDLPGYGFAKVSQAERQLWKKLIETYIAERQTLRAVVCIVDSEVGPTQLDVDLLGWTREVHRDAVVVATKLDRLGKAHRKPALASAAAALAVPATSVIGFSAKERLGVDAVWTELLSREHGPEPG